MILTVKEALAEAGKILKKDNIETPVKEAGVLLAFILGKDISWLYAHPEYVISPEILKEYKAVVEKRRSGMPFQYISNNQEFMALDFYVNQDCLIPRPETEILVEKALAWIANKNNDDIRVLDIGTGSGAISVSIAYYAKNVIVDAVDISDKALKIAEMNAKRHQVANRIRFINADFTKWENNEQYLVILSNPPYIPHDEIEGLMPGVKNFEPLTALDGGSDGLSFYRALTARTKRLLEPDGAVFTEVGANQAIDVKKMFLDIGLKAAIYDDLAGIARVVHAYC